MFFFCRSKTLADRVGLSTLTWLTRIRPSLIPPGWLTLHRISNCTWPRAAAWNRCSTGHQTRRGSEQQCSTCVILETSLQTWDREYWVTTTVNVVIFAGGKFRKNFGKTFHMGVIFTVLLICPSQRHMGFIFVMGVIFGEEQKTWKLPPRKNFHFYSIHSHELWELTIIYSHELIVESIHHWI